jgi:ferredoxin-NADP reductase/ferredoxin
MPRICFGEDRLELEPAETVLECLERHGHALPSACRAGACQTCVLQATRGEIPSHAQSGLKDSWKHRGYFLACVCRPAGDLEVQRIGEADRWAAEVVGVERLSATVTRVRLLANGDFGYEPGQYVTLFRADGLARSYSLASLPSERELEIHVRHVRGGRMSSWIHEQLRAGEQIHIRGPLGECFYVPGSPEDPLLLCGTGTGLAPLWGIVRQALHSGHRGPIAIVHGARDRNGLYHVEPLRALALTEPNVHYLPCVLADGGDEVRTGPLDTIALELLEQLGSPARVRAFLCGDPDIVQRLRRSLFLGGMSMARISMDAFVVGPAPQQPA